MKGPSRIIAGLYHCFFAVCGVGGIALVLYRWWDIETAFSSEPLGMGPAIATGVLMLGFGIYGIFFRKRIYPKYFGREIGSLPPAENWLHGASCVAGGLVLLMWTDEVAYGAMAWGVLQLVHGIVQRVLGGGGRRGRRGCRGRCVDHRRAFDRSSSPASIW